MKKKFSIMLLIICIASATITEFPLTADAASSGTCGSNLRWTLDNDGILTISGTGDMLFYSSNAPWYSSKDSITNILIKNGVTSISSSAFRDCTSLTNIMIPDSVVSIGSSAFRDCTSLTSITIPDGVTIIEEYTFYNCKSLASITIPDSVISIGSSAFRDCTSLTSITIPDGVTIIEEYTFYNCTSLTSITIPEGVTIIEEYTFYNCTSLASVTMSDNIARIGACVFENTYYYNNSSNWEDNILYIDEYLIAARDYLTDECVIKEGTKFLADSAFYNCTGLTKTTIPDSVVSIGWNTFENCTGLISITIPDSVTSIGWNAFANCTSLTSIKISNNVTCIEYNAFVGCTSLTSITIPNSITCIESYAFVNCTSLTSITMSVNITRIGACVFDNTSYYNNPLNWEDNILYIDEYLIAARDYLTDECVIKEGTKLLAAGAFMGCKGLTSVTIPDSVISIGNHSFESCMGLTSVTIGNNVTNIGYCAFYDCMSLTSLTIPHNVTHIMGSAFEGCRGLTDVYYIGRKEEWNNIFIDSGNRYLINATRHYTPKINICYNATGESDSWRVAIAASDSYVELITDIPERMGYIFLGWATTMDAAEAQFRPGDTITVGTEDITLYAVWRKVPYTTTTMINGIFIVVPTAVPVGSNIILVCYKSNKIAFVGKFEYDSSIVVPFYVDTEYDKVKVFVWDNIENMTPLTKPEIVF